MKKKTYVIIALVVIFAIIACLIPVYNSKKTYSVAFKAPVSEGCNWYYSNSNSSIVEENNFNILMKETDEGKLAIASFKFSAHNKGVSSVTFTYGNPIEGKSVVSTTYKFTVGLFGIFTNIENDGNTDIIYVED